MNTKSKSISFGDKIFARVTRNGQTIFNYVSEKVVNMTQLISEIRLALKDFSGLVMIHIRNYHQGWGAERPLMLYPEKTVSFNGYSDDRIVRFEGKQDRKMFFPWETH